MDETTKAAAQAAIMRLEDIEARETLIKADYLTKKAAIMAQVQDELDALDVEFEPVLSAVAAGIEQARDAVKAAVIAYGASVKGAAVHAVYSAGSDKWDAKALSGYAAAHPEIKVFCTHGAPSCTIRDVK